MKDAFIKLEPENAAILIGQAAPSFDIAFDPASTTVMVHDLEFYKGYFLAEFSRTDQHPPAIRHAVCNDKGEVHVLDWTNAPIYDLNKSIPITLDEENMANYVRFFFRQVRGKYGRFLIVDTVDDIDWREEPAAAGRKALGKMIEALHVKSRNPDGSVIFNASIIFRHSLFAAEIHLQKDGNIHLQNEELLVEDIPVSDDLFGQ